MAARHVSQGRRLVAEQRERIARLKADGLPTTVYEHTLVVFETTLQTLEDHEQLLHQEYD
jgi:hypothetical protein